MPNLSRLVSDDPSRAEGTHTYDEETEGNYYGHGKSLGAPTSSNSKSGKRKKVSGLTDYEKKI